MEVQRINPQSMSTPLAAYSQVVRRGPTVTTAGLIVTDAMAGEATGLDEIEMPPFGAFQ